VVKVFGPVPQGDALCPEHGGKGEGPKWTEDQLKAAKAQEAEEILFQADAGWLSKSPAVRTRSREAYRRLLEDFGATEIVTSNQARIKSRSEAEIED
jgi:hypothetical protein